MKKKYKVYNFKCNNCNDITAHWNTNAIEGKKIRWFNSDGYKQVIFALYFKCKNCGGFNVWKDKIEKTKKLRWWGRL